MDEGQATITVKVTLDGVTRVLRRRFAAQDALSEVAMFIESEGQLACSCAAHEVMDATTFPPRELALQAVGSTNVMGAGLWPSATLEVRLRRSVMLRVRTTRDGDGTATLRVRPDATFADVVCEAMSALPAAFDGQVSAAEWFETRAPA